MKTWKSCRDGTNGRSPNMDSRDCTTSDEEQVSWFERNVQRRSERWYQRYIEEGLLRRKPLPPSKNGRRVPLQVKREEPLQDERRGHAYISNSIRSSRYTIWDFLPKQFLFQATRLSNFYFICIGVPQTIPGLSTTGNYTTILPLTFFMLLVVIKEGYDDYRRHRMDKVENNLFASVLRSKSVKSHHLSSISGLSRLFSSCSRLLRISKTRVSSAVMHADDEEDDSYAWTNITWHSITVGDVLKLRRDEAVPADIVLLHASGENGVAYIETMALDGETNLKSKQALPALSETCSTIKGLRNKDAEFVLEDPNKNLYDFNGKATVDSKTLPITLSEVIYRGSIIRNTDHAIGMVINTGEECKIRQNANHHPQAKKPRLEKYANQVVLTLIVYVVVLSVGLSMGYLIWHNDYESKAWYLNNGYVAFKQIIVGYLIMFNNVIPLALYVSLEIVKIGQMIMVQSDVEMYDEETNTPMTCNTNTILENLGQISYVLTDKTGTLTDNVMRFRGMSIGGMVWMVDEEVKTEQAKPSTDVGKTASIQAGSKSGSSSRPGIVIKERELSTMHTHEEQPKPRPSAQISVRTSMSSQQHTHADRSAKELLDIIRRHPDSSMARKAHEFILGMAICHTAIPEDGSASSTSDFQASSPDELALVRAAQDLGYQLVRRSSQRIDLLIQMADGSQLIQTYEVLDVIEFSSKRKRMSIVVRCPDGRLWLICKGADNALIPRLRQSELAVRKSVEVRRSMDVERRLQRKSGQYDGRLSMGVRPSLNVRGRSSQDIRGSMDIRRVGRTTLEVPRKSLDVRHSLQNDLRILENTSDAEIFTRCFKHLDDFATDGLRVLLFGHRYLDEAEYAAWRNLYEDASTSLSQRQELIDAAGELIEQGFDLLGASAIEDKLQAGVPETIEKLRRANIRIWMLTGDKRETAINIAHAAQICLPSSTVFVLDVTKGELLSQMSCILTDLTSDGDDQHGVAVIDGHTLSAIQADLELKHYFFSTIMTILDSVIVCRASPSQKADIVKALRARQPGLTLAIGDGANDIAMLQAAHVGVGISGKEGLQAARVADFSLAQFRFLQRLLLVHGRYQYVRTAKFVLYTFWKEMFFYMMQALFQHYDGYTGASLYESWSLTVLNTLFTSLCVIVPGILEQDLRPETLLAMPELYTYGQQNKGLNLPKYIAWMILAVVDGLIVWFLTYTFYGSRNTMGDNGLFALGDLSFTLGILWTNWKLFMIETHYKTPIVLGSFVITVAGWFAWNAFMSGIYPNNTSPFDVNGGFLKIFGTEWTWWLTLILTFSALGTMELVYLAIRRQLLRMRLWPPWPRRGREKRRVGEMELEVWQEMERLPEMRETLAALARREGKTEDEGLVYQTM